MGCQWLFVFGVRAARALEGQNVVTASVRLCVVVCGFVGAEQKEKERPINEGHLHPHHHRTLYAFCCEQGKS